MFLDYETTQWIYNTILFGVHCFCEQTGKYFGSESISQTQFFGKKNFWFFLNKIFWVSDFESLSSSVGKYSTKYWLRDYQKFIQENEEDEEFIIPLKNKNEILQFLNWPEFEFWKGFIQIDKINIE